MIVFNFTVLAMLTLVCISHYLVFAKTFPPIVTRSFFVLHFFCAEGLVWKFLCCNYMILSCDFVHTGHELRYLWLWHLHLPGWLVGSAPFAQGDDSVRLHRETVTICHIRLLGLFSLHCYCYLMVIWLIRVDSCCACCRSHLQWPPFVRAFTQVT